MALTRSDYDYISRLVRERSAIVLESGKEYLVELRLKRILRMAGLDTMEHLVIRLRSNQSGDLRRAVVEAMTTNETSFFRDVHPFETLRKSILPEVIQRSANRELHLWCAACASGQEAYTIAMVLCEHFPELQNRKLRLLATDLSSLMIARSREGRYSQLEINRGLPAAMLVKYFQKVGMDWQIKDTLRQMIEFRELNLAAPWPRLPPLDIVFLRNVLIYFDDTTKKDILNKLQQVLRPGGYLFLGGAETTLNLDARFEQVKFERTICYRVRD